MENGKLKLGLIDCGSTILDSFQRSSQFESIEVLDSDNFKGGSSNPDVVVVDASKVDENSIVEFVQGNLMNVSSVFYRLHKPLDELSLKFLEGSKITILSHLLDDNQCVERVVKVVYQLIKRDNVFVFYGADRKVGVTSIAQDVCDYLTKGGLKVGFVDLSGHINHHYLEVDKGTSESYIGHLEDLRAKMVSNVLSTDDIKNAFTATTQGVSVLKGFRSILNIRHFSVDMVEKVLDYCRGLFDIVIIDAGSPSDLTVSMGGLVSSRNRILVTTDSLSCLENFRSFNDGILGDLDISGFLLVLNKIAGNSGVISKELASAYGVGSLIATLPYCSDGIVSENNIKLLKDTTSNKKYAGELKVVSDFILRYLELGEVEPAKKQGLFSRARR